MFGEAMKKLTYCFEEFHSLVLEIEAKTHNIIDFYKGQN